MDKFTWPKLLCLLLVLIFAFPPVAFTALGKAASLRADGLLGCEDNHHPGLVLAAAAPAASEPQKLNPYPSITAPPYNCDSTGATDIAGAIEQLKARQNNTGTIYFPPGKWLVGTNLTIPAGMHLKMAKDAVMELQPGKTLSIKGTFEAPLRQCFSLTGQVVFGASEARVQPQWWGAKGDGVTDDTAAINAAIASGCRELFFPAGTYLVKKGKNLTAIGLRSNLVISGAGKGSILKNHADVSGSIFWSMIGVASNKSPVENILIENIAINGNVETVYDKAKQHRHGIHFTSPNSTISNIIIRKVYVENTGGDGIIIGKNCKNVLIEQCELKDCLRQHICATGYGIENLSIKNNVVLESVRSMADGVHLEIDGSPSPRKVEIVNNLSRYGMTVGGYAYNDRLTDLNVKGNHIYGKFTCTKVNQAMVAGNVVEETKQSAPGYLGVFRSLSNTIIADNKFLATSHAAGIQVYPAWGGSLSSMDDKVIIRNNVIKAMSAKGYGIFISKMNGVIITDNKISNSSNYGIYATNNRSLSITNNDIDTQSAAADSIFINNYQKDLSSYASVFKISGNRIKQNPAKYGINVNGGVRPILEGNKVSSVNFGKGVQP
jgi:hypothetical protein